jgi:hypothetical protein
LRHRQLVLIPDPLKNPDCISQQCSDLRRDRRRTARTHGPSHQSHRGGDFPLIASGFGVGEDCAATI